MIRAERRILFRAKDLSHGRRSYLFSYHEWSVAQGKEGEAAGIVSLLAERAPSEGGERVG